MKQRITTLMEGAGVCSSVRRAMSARFPALTVSGLSLCVLLMSAGFAHADDNPPPEPSQTATSQLSALIVPTSCAIGLEGGNDVSLDEVMSDSIQSTSPLSERVMTLDISCPGVSVTGATANMQVSGTVLGGVTSQDVFRDAGDANPSTTLGFKVQAGKVGSATPDWNSVAYMVQKQWVPVADEGATADKQQLPMRFSMWCTDSSLTSCKKSGRLKATVQLAFEYK